MWECSTIARSPTLSRRLMPASPSCGATDGDEVQCRVEVPLPEGEVGGRDRGGEAVVEGLGQAEALVDRVPAELDRQLVGAQLAGVKEAVELDRGEMVPAEPAKLLGAVLVHVPGVVGLLGPRRRQGQQVGGGEEGAAWARRHRLEAPAERA